MTIKQAYLFGLLSGLVKKSAVLSPKVLSSLIVGHSELGYLPNMRPVVAVKLAPEMNPLLFYRSAHGTSNKIKSTWYPFFGLNKSDHWLIKGHATGWKGDSLTQMESGYGNPKIKTVMDSLNKLFGKRKQQLDVTKELFNKFRPLTREYPELSKEIYGAPYFNFNPKTNPVASLEAAFHIRKILAKTLGYNNIPSIFSRPPEYTPLTPEQQDRLLRAVGFRPHTAANVQRKAG